MIAAKSCEIKEASFIKYFFLSIYLQRSLGLQYLYTLLYYITPLIIHTLLLQTSNLNSLACVQTNYILSNNLNFFFIYLQLCATYNYYYLQGFNTV
jgi:hypothetical protein